VTITTGPDSWSYREMTTLHMDELDEPLPHTDHTTLRRVG